MSTVPGLPDGAEPRPAAGASESTPQVAGLDAVRARGEAAQRSMAAFGGIVTVMMQSPAFQHRSLSDLKDMVMPAVVTGQFWLAHARHKDSGEIRPIGAVLWASVSDEVDQRLTADPNVAIRLQLDEWRSGANLWIVEGIGERTIVANLIRGLRQKDWQGQAVKIKVRGQDGGPIVRLLPAA